MCEGPLDQPATGRPRVYCGQTCRRAAEMAIRRIQSQLAMAEKRAMLAGEHVATAWDSTARSGPRKVLKYWQGEVNRLQAVLLSLLEGTGDQGDQGVSPPEAAELRVLR
jgi:hypothetical protein